jgi:UDP-2,3-diacylglucosamine pyrophosphatase LpxH
VVISDTHLGIDNGAADMLCEFLRNTTCDTLILNGDIIDGVRLNNRRPKDFPELDKRVLDALNRKIAEGTEVIYIPGNHDTALRRMGLFGKTVMGVRFEKSLDFTDAKGRRFFISHGDSFDGGQTHPKKVPNALHKVFDHGYVAATRLSSAVDRITQKVARKHFKLAAKARTVIEGPLLHTMEHHEKNATDYARKHGYDGAICGHFHKEVQSVTKEGTIYLNSGDWVESFTALAMNRGGDWSVIKWPEKRKALHLDRKAAAQNPDIAYRPATEKILAEVKKIWPGRKNNPKP